MLKTRVVGNHSFFRKQMPMARKSECRVPTHPMTNVGWVALMLQRCKSCRPTATILEKDPSFVLSIEFVKNGLAHNVWI